MKQYLELLSTRFRTWQKAKVLESKQPLTRENAYVLSSIGERHGKYSSIRNNYHKEVLDNIKNAARTGASYLLQEHPTWLAPSDKEELVRYLSELGYTVCYSDSTVILISWLYSPEDCKSL